MRGINPPTRREPHATASERKREPSTTDNSRGLGSVNKPTSLPFFFRVFPVTCRARRERRAGVAARGCVRAIGSCEQSARVSARRVRVVAHRTDVQSRWYHRRRRRMYGERLPGLADYAIRLPPPRGEEVCLACQHTSMVQVSERGTLCEGLRDGGARRCPGG